MPNVQAAIPKIEPTKKKRKSSVSKELSLLQRDNEDYEREQLMIKQIKEQREKARKQDEELQQNKSKKTENSSQSQEKQKEGKDPETKDQQQAQEEVTERKHEEKDTFAESTSPKKSVTPPSTIPDISEFYQFNENFDDKGCLENSSIVKSWGPTYSKLKPKGLLNHGVTCYTNAAVQALLHIPAMQHYLNDILAGKYSSTISSNSVSHVLAETSRRMWHNDGKKSGNSYINPKKLIARLDDINCMMSEWQQEDSHEYFMSIMSRLQEDSVPKGHKMTESIIYDIFGGSLKQTVTCKSCGEVSTTEQPFYDLSLHLKGKKTDENTVNQEKSSSQSETKDSDSQTSRYSIEKSIKDFFNPELIKVDKEKKGYVCEKCHKTTNALKRNSILRAPETLLVHVKKFRFNGTSSSKMKQAVSYPMFLDMTEYCEESKKMLPVKYELLSVVVHEGRSLSSGHYIAHCKQPDGSWATYDDEYINKITEREVLKERNAYYVLYTRLTPKSVQLNEPKKQSTPNPITNVKQNNGKNNKSNKRSSNKKNWKKNKRRRL